MRTRLGLVRVWGAVVLAGLVLVGCAAMTGGEGAGEEASDTAITAKLKASFAAGPLLRAAAIGVRTSGGVVHLTGRVTSEPARQRAIQLVQGVAGVREIVLRELAVQRSPGALPRAQAPRVRPQRGAAPSPAQVIGSPVSTGPFVTPR